MDFAFNDEQLMIQESAANFLAKASDSAAVRAAMSSEQGYDALLWQQIAQELYWPALIIPEQYGGLGLGFVEQAILLEQMGRRLLCSPFLASACLATPALLLGSNEALREQWLPELASGNLIATLAFAHRRNEWRQSTQPHASQTDGGWLLNGQFESVLEGDKAGLLIVCTQQANGELALFAINSDQHGVERVALPTLDQTRRLAKITLNQVSVTSEQCLNPASNGAELLDKVLQIGAIALACEQVGGAQQALDLTLAYVAERRQFNRPIASFQAIKHRCADLMLAIENARSASYYAACVAQEALSAEGDLQLAAELAFAAPTAKSEASEAFMQCTAESIQLHGGVGFTWEYDPHLYFKRARASEQLLGTPAWHRERLATLILESRP
ncbi:acyl-CoA dehydrogenase family protein [Pseudomonas sp. TTU2014-080ASC]|uniref:acyl-CoA dehydrogenase family protein n=1 Tax=Pseudomonas sp. TTU2014-080ASC TaxID=1729724 RepID=UPI00071880D8|nr:acyl-CoA dehydrogenase family protein [Pseudomonas sp. TTU2014-080ASC]KRW57455.1 acyl-CoA dehydrogenase [Pseudomonas sp. TTU2014-080ASC]